MLVHVELCFWDTRRKTPSYIHNEAVNNETCPFSMYFRNWIRSMHLAIFMVDIDTVISHRPDYYLCTCHSHRLHQKIYRTFAVHCQCREDVLKFVHAAIVVTYAAPVIL